MRNTPKLGKAATPRGGQWVQTDRRAHEAWAALIQHKPRAARLLHHLVSQMVDLNAVVISQKTLSKLMGVSLRTVQYAVDDLVEGRWIEVVRVNGPGTAAAYVVNDRVAWGQAREDLRLSTFSATVVADFADQPRAKSGDLRRIPTLYPGERQLPTGPGEDPPADPALDGLEPDLPALIDSRQGSLI